MRFCVSGDFDKNEFLLFRVSESEGLNGDRNWRIFYGRWEMILYSRGEWTVEIC